MFARSLIEGIKTTVLALVVAALTQAVLIDICVVLSAGPASKALTSLPTLTAFAVVMLRSFGPRWSRCVPWLLIPTLVFFAAGLLAYRAGLPYGLIGLLGATFSALAVRRIGTPRKRDGLPIGITNYPRPKALSDASEVRSVVSRLTSMPYSYTLIDLGRALLRQLRTESEEGRLALVLYRSDKGKPTASVGSYEPITLHGTGADRSVAWESSLICFGLDVQSLSPYTLPARIALQNGLEVVVPASLAHGRWAVVCAEPSAEAVRAIGVSLLDSGWKVDSPALGYIMRTKQLFSRRGSPRARVSDESNEPSRYDFMIQTCTPSSTLNGGLVGVILSPGTPDLERFLPKNSGVSSQNPRPLMVIGSGHVTEWRDGGWM